MPLIEITLEINAPIQRCFDLARSIDLHQISTSRTKEKAVGGKISGLIELGETVSWRAKHFGIWQYLTIKITQFDAPYHFRDEMIKGAFKSFQHDHFFKEQNGQTMMTDRFEFKSPFGLFGILFNKLILKNYMRKFLTERNFVIKNFAETDKWQTVLS